MIYKFIQNIIKIALAIFFQKIEIRHGENIPERGPVLLAVNHPDSQMDAFVLSSTIKRKVHYIAHAGLFANKLKAKLLQSCGVIPVSRKRDESEDVGRNVEAFQECYEVLEKEKVIGIFPEGISEMARRVRKIKTGAARIVLESERRNNYELGVNLIPIGLHFFSRSRFRSRVLVNVGRPIDLQPYFSLNGKDNVEAVVRLTAKIQESLEHLTVNVQHTELDRFVRDIESIYRDDLMTQTLADHKSSKKIVAEFVITQKIADCVEYFHENNPQKVRDMEEKISDYKRKLKRLHLKDIMVREKTSIKKLFRAELTGIAKAIVGFPLAVYGVLNNFFPYRITEFIVKKFIDDKTKILMALLLGGGITFILFYGAQFFLVWYLAGYLWAILYFCTLPLSGFFALDYGKEIRQIQERISFSFFLFTNKHLIGKMRRTRNMLIAEMNSCKDEYLEKMNKETSGNK
ncbi:MAG: 1-acyl-sn-glycerol-3-phosphate acyltransferase [Candidatus Aminicenantes bacterium]|nr:MAG: 1-acyl-sn-glycerol-3-phosphate acyltransferase [Candidatus Aminicenantes bacterium]